MARGSTPWRGPSTATTTAYVFTLLFAYLGTAAAQPRKCLVSLVEPDARMPSLLRGHHPGWPHKVTIAYLRCNTADAFAADGACLSTPPAC